MKNKGHAWTHTLVGHRSNIEETPIFISDDSVSGDPNPIFTVGSVYYPAMNCRVAGI